MEKIFDILRSEPVVSIICTTVIILALIFVLRKQIVAYIKKKYNLFDEEQVLNLIQQSVKEDRKKQEILREFKKLKE